MQYVFLEIDFKSFIKLFHFVEKKQYTNIITHFQTKSRGQGLYYYIIILQNIKLFKPSFHLEIILQQ